MALILRWVALRSQHPGMSTNGDKTKCHRTRTPEVSKSEKLADRHGEDSGGGERVEGEGPPAGAPANAS